MMNSIEILRSFELALSDFENNPEWQSVMRIAEVKNPWFTQENIKSSLDSWRTALNNESISKWLIGYKEELPSSDKVLGIIGAGNIPLVVMHDVLVGLISGLKLKIKLSSDDEELPKFWINKAQELCKTTLNIEYVERLNDIDIAIATGSNNTNRYFEYYFKNTPNVLRKNRNSLAVLGMHDTYSENQYMQLGNDIFSYFGLGCRNVTHIKVPQGFDFKPMIQTWEKHFIDLANHNKYINNYNYHKALLLMNLDPHIDSGFVLMKESESLYSPVGVVYYSFYNDIEDVKNFIIQNKENIQCVVSDLNEISNVIKIGSAQCPKLWDYADGVDTLSFLRKELNMI